MPPQRPLFEPSPSPRGREPILDEFDALLKNCTRKSVIHEPHREFILARRLLEWFRRAPKYAPGTTNAGQVLKAVYGPNGCHPNLLQGLLATMKDAYSCWLEVFIVLLKLKRGKYIGKFYTSGLVDRRLPIADEDLNREISKMLGTGSEDESREFATEFFQLQYRLCTKDSLDSTGGRILDPVKILPVCTKDRVKPGGSGKIFQIQIPCECIPKTISDRMRSKPYANGEKDGETYHEFALKVLKDRQDYDQEALAYSALKGREGIVQCLGDWEMEKSSTESEFHLLLEYGSYDLDEYFETVPPPSLPRRIINFWKALATVGIALDKIHDIAYTVEGQKTDYYGWHGDIKPENILFCDGGWKIADPGFARLIPHGEAKFDENNLPVIELRGGTITYGPPEQSNIPKNPVTQRFDIWSLGCLFSEAATWVLLGPRGVEQYRIVRKSVENGNRHSISLDEIRGDDCFHNCEDVSSAVLDWHDYLRNSLREKDCITGAILNLIENGMLRSSARDRMSSRELVNRLTFLLENAENDKSLGKYQPPKYFQTAFAEEQRKAEEQWSNPAPRSETRKSNRYKSTRFQLSSGSVDVDPDAPSYDQPLTPAPLLTVPSQDAFPYQNLKRADAVTGSMIQRSLVLTTEMASSVPDDHEREPSPDDQPEERGRFNYWDALQLLESQGWVYKGTLERPQQPQSPPSPSPPNNLSLGPPLDDRSEAVENQLGTRRTPSRLSRPKSSGGSSIFSRNLFRRNSSMKQPAPSNRRSTGPTVNQQKAVSNYQRAVSETSTGKTEVDKKYKNSIFDEYFDKRDVVFLLDNGSTMGNHWPMVRELVAVLVSLLHGQDDDGMDIYFTSSRKKYGPFTEPKEFVDRINQKKPKGEKYQDATKQAGMSEDANADDIRQVLSHILSLVGRANYGRKLTLIILTDGIWTGIASKRTVANLIINCLEQWEDQAALKDMLSVRGLSLQFVQFGDDPLAKKELGYMDDELAKSDGTRLPDIIDLEPATGNIKKMILGSLSNDWDGDETTIASDELRRIDQGEWTGFGSAVSSPTQNPIGRYADMIDEPAEYLQPQNPHGTYYNPGIDTQMSGSQFGPQVVRPPARASTAHPQPGANQGTPSRHRTSTRDSINTAPQYGRQQAR